MSHKIISSSTRGHLSPIFSKKSFTRRRFDAKDISLTRVNSLILALIVLFCASTSGASSLQSSSKSTGAARVDHIRLHTLDHRKAFKSEYNVQLLKLALEKTKKNYGDYTISHHGAPSTSLRSFLELSKPKGKLGINVHVAIASPERNATALAIEYPVRLGLMSYRLVVARASDRALFETVDSLPELKSLSTGVIEHWTSVRILTENNFNIVMGQSSDKIFDMLRSERYDYIFRGVSEIYSERETEKKKFKDLIIAPKIAIFVPMPYYVYVTPRDPRLHKRLSEGLGLAVEDGSLRALFFKFYSDFISKAALGSRNIFYVSNPLLKGHQSLSNAKYWYLHDDNLASNMADDFRQLSAQNAR